MLKFSCDVALAGWDASNCQRCSFSLLGYKIMLPRSTSNLQTELETGLLKRIVCSQNLHSITSSPAASAQNAKALDRIELSLCLLCVLSDARSGKGLHILAYQLHTTHVLSLPSCTGGSLTSQAGHTLCALSKP